MKLDRRWKHFRKSGLLVYIHYLNDCGYDFGDDSHWVVRDLTYASWWGAGSRGARQGCCMRAGACLVHLGPPPPAAVMQARYAADTHTAFIHTGRCSTPPGHHGQEHR